MADTEGPVTKGAGPRLGPSLTRRRPPWAVFTLRNDPWPAAATAELLERDGRVFRLDGRELLERGTLFTVFARELGFPGYFGHNWDALVDCLHDRHDEQDTAVVIDHADGLLGVDFLGVFVSVLCQAAWRANLRLDADGVPDPDWNPFALHFVFLLDSASPAAFAEAVSAGMDMEVSLDEGRLMATLAGDDWPTCGSGKPE
ncbi:barstar family protein [Streptomyces sp. NPDC087859]|uniref:barstar family protein n=1 Tax=Streptomyces sp. NPDC087859 TaxID=3365812 RepID=UPI00382E6FCB